MQTKLLFFILLFLPLGMFAQPNPPAPPPPPPPVKSTSSPREDFGNTYVTNTGRTCYC